MRPVPSKGPPGTNGTNGAAGATGPAGPAPAGSAGDQVRLVSTGVAGATSPDLICLAAELATTYAPSAVLRGVIAYTSDTLLTYVCRRTAVSTYAWMEFAVAGASGTTEYTEADLALVQGAGSCAASIVSGRLRLALDTASARRYGTVSGVWTAEAPRGIFSVPSGAREVVAALRPYSASAQIDYNFLGVLARKGADPVTPTNIGGIRMPSTGIFGTQASVYTGEGYADGYPPGSGALEWWPATPGASHSWWGLRCTPGLTQLLAWTDPTDTPTLDLAAVSSHTAGQMASTWRMPSELVFCLQRFSGGVTTAISVDLDVRVWVTL